jgi:hypothetical protein
MHEMLVGKPERKRLLGKLRCRWEDNIKIYLKVIGCDWGVKLTTHLHLVPRSKNEWSYTFTHPIRLHGVVLS